MHDCTGLTHLRENIHFDASTLQSRLVFPLSLAFTVLSSATFHALLFISCTHALCFTALSSVTDRLPQALEFFIYSFLCECYLSPTITLTYKVKLKGLNKGSERILSTLLKASAG